MTDEKTSKPAWWRCPACKTRVWNDPVDKEAHRGSCPADLQRAIRRLAGRIEKLEQIIQEIPEPVQLEALAGPDLDSVDEDDLETGPEDEEEPLEVPDILPAAVTYYEAPKAIDDYDEEDEDEEQAPVTLPVMR